MSLSLPIITPTNTTLPSVQIERWINNLIIRNNKQSIDWNILQSLLNIHNIMATYQHIDLPIQKRKLYEELMNDINNNYSALWSPVVLNSDIVNGIEFNRSNYQFLENNFYPMYETYRNLLDLVNLRAISFFR